MKILYVATISNTINAFLIPHIKMLIDAGNTVDVAFNIQQEVKQEILKMNCNVYDIPFSRNPLGKDNIFAYKKIKNIISLHNYDMVHTHTPVASVIVRLVCKRYNIKVCYTAHGFHFFKGAPLLNWIVFYPVEKMLSKYTDVLITINKEDYVRSKKFYAKKIEYTPGVGINIDKINCLNVDRYIKRQQLEISNEAFVLLSVGELNNNKNHEIVIRALASIQNEQMHYIICGEGALKEKLVRLSLDMGIEKQVHFLGYRQDVLEIYKIVDLFVFPSLREGLSVSLMEAMACGLPVVCSNIRGNSDLIKDDLGGALVDSNSLESYILQIKRVYNNPDAAKQFGEYNKTFVKKFSTNNVIERMREIYTNI